ncbi:MAG: hypothetical protein K2Z81_28390 [Cyanobacteria bacterium]|nr:hypothetical protein [Cyanobacteriota bacterium]
MGEAKAKLRSDEITLKREKRQKIPDVVLSGGGGYDQLDKGFAARANLEVVNIPLFDRNQGTVQQAMADLSRQRAQVQLVEMPLQKQLQRVLPDELYDLVMNSNHQVADGEVFDAIVSGKYKKRR